MVTLIQANHRAALDAGSTRCLHVESQWPGPSEHDRYRMKNLQLWSRSTDRKILTFFCSVCALAFASFVGYAYPTSELENLHVINAFITGISLIFVWGVSGLLRPAHASQTWKTAEAFAVPLIWMLLAVLFLLWLHNACDLDLDREALAYGIL